MSLVALVGLRAESAIFLRGGHSFETRAAALEAGGARLGWSSDSHERAMRYCFEVLGDARIWTPPLARRDAVLRSCRAQGRAIVALSVADGLAWATRAYIEAENGVFEAAFAALERSRVLAPEEMWITSRRVVVGERLRALMDEAQRAGHDADLLVMGSSRRGVEALSRRLSADEDFRERMIAIMEQQPDALQRAFLRNLRRELRRQQEGA